jgi:membrane protein YdbS with pleckstrin-like domain
MNYDNYSNDQYVWDSKAFPQKSNAAEDIILIVRQDVIVLVLRFLGGFMAVLIMLIVKLVLYSIGFQIAPFIDAIINTFIIGFCLVFALNFMQYFHNYYLSLQLVTSDRIIDIDQTGLFKREVNELAISNIQDVTYKQTGLIQTFFGFGQVIVKTAGSDNHQLTKTAAEQEQQVGGFIFENCSQPAKVSGIISDIYHKFQEQSDKKTAVAHAQELKKVIDNHTQLGGDY